MSQELKEVPIEVVLEEANKILKMAGLTGESKFMNRPAVMRLCGPPVEQRRISDADTIRSIAKSTGRYPYVVFAFRGREGVVCVPDGNYYAADGLYDVHIVDCPDGAVCAELAKHIADLFRMPKPPKEALLRLADEQTLCEHQLLPPSACTATAATAVPKKEEKGEEYTSVAPQVEAPPPPPPTERISASTREFLKILQELDQYDKSGKVVPAAPSPQPQQPPDLKAVLKEHGLGWLLPVIEDASTASAVRFVLENEDLRKALQGDLRKVILEVAKSGGVVPEKASALDEMLSRWPPRHREALLKMLSKSKDLNTLTSMLLQYIFNNEHCTLDAVQFIIDASRNNMGLDCKTAAKAVSQWSQW
jgi:hypothetical protein